MKKSKVFLALVVVLLVVLCCSAAGCFDSASTEKKNADTITSAASDPSETDEKRIKSGYRQDRIEIYYINKSGEHLPWDVIHKFDVYVPDYEEDMLLQIPDEMTLVEAIEYCQNINNIAFTIPGESYIRSVVYGESQDMPNLRTDMIEVRYINNTSYRLPWSLISDYNGAYRYYVPENMTFPEAFAYCNTIDEIIHVGYIYKYYYANG